ncbi:peptidylprolyl isomerase [Deferrisoma palaeochoriense]
MNISACFRSLAGVGALVALLAASAVAGARGGAPDEVVARVGGEPIYREEVLHLARFELGLERDEVKGARYLDALKKAVTNHAVFRLVQKEAPELLPHAERAATLAAARDYYRAYYARVAMPAARERMTLEKVIEKIPEREDLAYIFQITMSDRTELERIRERIVAGELTFENAARSFSEGITARVGGEVGGIKRTDDRYYPETLRLIFDETPVGEITPVVKERLGYAVFWVKDRKTAEEVRRAEAESVLGDYVEADAKAYCWDRVHEYDHAHADTELYVTEAEAQAFVDDPDRVALRVDGVAYTVRDLLARSGGSVHSLKDITTIAENSFRDLILMKLFVDRFGEHEAFTHRKNALLKHYAVRLWFREKTDDLTVSEEEVDRYLAEHQDKYALPERADLGVIYVKTEKRLDQVLERLKVEDFETVAKGWSQDKRLAAKGGRVGVVPLRGVEGDLSSVAPGTVLDPVYIDQGEAPGYYVFKLYRYYPAEQGTRENLGEEVIGGVRSMIMAEKRKERLSALVERARSGVEIELLGDVL